MRIPYVDGEMVLESRVESSVEGANRHVGLNRVHHRTEETRILGCNPLCVNTTARWKGMGIVGP